MFKRIRKTLQDASKGNLQPSSTIQESSDQTSDAASGFICPMCMAGFSSGDLLQVHFDEVHTENLDSSQSPPPMQNSPVPMLKNESTKVEKSDDIDRDSMARKLFAPEPLHAVDKMKQASNDTEGVSADSGDAGRNMPSDVGNEANMANLDYSDLETTLEEEKWYSNELKQELERKESELKSQAEELNLVKQQMGIAIKTNEELAREKEKVMEKLINKSEECATLQSTVDEMKSEKQQYVESAKNQSTELEKAAVWIRDLESQLIERPGADDVLVLKKELVSVQQLMDQLTQDSEKELYDAKHTCQTLEDEKKLLLKQIESMKFDFERDLASQKSSQAILADSLQQKESLSSQAVEEANREHEKLKEEILNIETTLKNEQSHSRALELKNVDLEEKCSSEKEQKEKLQTEIYSLKSEYAKAKKECEILTLELSAKDEELTKAKESITKVMADSQASSSTTGVALHEKTSQLENLTQKYNDVVNEVGTLKRELEEAVKLKDSNQEKLNTAQAAQQQLELDKSLEIQKLEQCIESLKTKLSHASTSDSVLHEKIKILEEDAKKAWNEIHEEKSKNRIVVLEHENQLSTVNDEKAKAENELQRQSARLQEANESRKSVERNLAEKEEVIKTLQVEITSLQRNGEGLERNLQEVKRRADSINKEKSNILSDVKRLQQERSDLMEKMEVGEGQAVLVGQLKDEIESLSKRLEESQLRAKEAATKHSAIVEKLEIDIGIHTASKKQLEESLSSAQSHTKSLQEMIESDKNEKLVLMKQLENADSEEQKLKELLSNQKIEFESTNSLLQRSLEEKTREHAKLSSTYEGFKSSSESSMKMMEVARVELQETLNATRQENTKIEVEKKGFEERLATKEQEIEGLKASFEDMKIQHKSDKDALKDKYQVKKANLNLQLQTTQEHLLKAEGEIDSTKASIVEMKGSLSDKAKTIKLLEIDLKEKESIIDNLKTKNDDVTTKADQLIEDIQIAKQNHETEVSRLKEEHAELVKKLTVENERVCEKLQRNVAESNDKSVKLTSEFNDKIEQLDAEAKAKIIEIINLKASLDEKSNVLETLTTQYATEKEDLETNIQSSRKKLNDLEAANEKLMKIQQTTEAALNDKIQELTDVKSKLSVLEKQSQTQFEEMKGLSAMHDETIKSLEIMTHEKEIITEKFNATTQEIHEVQEQKTHVESSLSQVRQHYDSSIKDKEALESKVVVIEANLKDVEASLNVKEEELNTVKQYFSVKERELLSIKESLELQTEKYKSEITEEKRKLEEEIFFHNQDKETWKSEKQQMVEDEKAKALQWSNEKDELLQSQEMLKGAQQILISSKMDLQKHLNATMEELNQEKDKFNKAEESHKMQLAEHATHQEELEKQLKDLEQKLKATEDEKESMKERLQLEVSTLRENLDSVRGEWQQALQQVEEKNTESDELRGQVVVLQATVQNNADERRALLERCLTAEQSVEQYKQNESQLKKRLDNAQAAMHELGRENQAMQVKHSTVLSRQWADDRVAVECMACRKPFSMTVRRHHCRHCGKIFCAECSSKTTTVAASKKPVRVCEKCYDDLITVQ